VSEFNTDPDRSVDEILKDIEKGAFDASQRRANLLGAVLAPFAGLLVKLSREAEATSQRVEKLTKRLYSLTIFIVILTLLLFVRELVKDGLEVYYKHSLQNQTHQQDQ
jgi:hypothetical protein